MARFSFRPTFTLRGRRFLGIRGWAGKPMHPPLTDVPIGAYMLAAAFDVVSWIGGDADWARDFYRAGTFALIGGVLVAVPTALTGFMDWLKSTPKGTQARRTANAHGITMATVTVLVLVTIAIRLGAYDEPSTPALAGILTLVVAGLTFLGAAIGGTLVYDYGFNVHTAGDSPAWHPSERDLLPGEKP